jgi:cytochrome c oxidase assembly factor CtaG
MFAFSPGVIALVAIIEVLYVRAVHILRRRGYRVPVRQQLSWHVGMALQAFALLGPLDVYADDLLSSHMAQHLLLADVAVPFLLIGMRTPVLVFIPPTWLLKSLARRRGLRKAFRTVRQPIPAVGIYLVVLYFWHFGFAFEGALRHPVVHALQHISFVAIGVLIWWSALEPQRRRLRGELWKIPYILASRMISMFLGVAFVAARNPLYGSYYGDRPRNHGLSPITDQVIAGATMMSLDIIIMMGALIFFFYRASEDDHRAEAGQAAAAAAR